MTGITIMPRRFASCTALRTSSIASASPLYADGSPSDRTTSILRFSQRFMSSMDATRME